MLINLQAEDKLDSKHVENCASGIISNSTENCAKQTKGIDILKKRVSKELKTGNVSKSFAKNDIVKLANAKEELVQLQKMALQVDTQVKERNNNTQTEILQTELEISKEKLNIIKLDIQTKERNDNTQREILQTELGISKEKLKLIKLDVQLKEWEVEVKKQQFTKLL